MSNNGSNIMQYQEWKPEEAVGEAEAVAASGEGGGFWKPKVGDNRIRILPTRRGLHPSPMLVTWCHYVELPGTDKGVGFCCPRKMKAGWPCPACVRVDELRATKNPADYDAAGDYLAKLRVFCNIIDRDNEEAGVQVYAMGKTVYEPLIAYRNRDPREDEPFTNVDDTGSDVFINKKGELLTTKYAVRLAKHRGPLHDDATVVQEWLESMRDLSPEARVLSVAEIRAKLAGETPDRGRGGRGAPREDRRAPPPREAPPREAPPRGRPRSVADDVIDTEGTDVPHNGSGGYVLHPDD